MRRKRVCSEHIACNTDAIIASQFQYLKLVKQVSYKHTLFLPSHVKQVSKWLSFDRKTPFTPTEVTNSKKSYCTWKKTSCSRLQMLVSSEVSWQVIQYNIDIPCQIVSPNGEVRVNIIWSSQQTIVTENGQYSVCNLSRFKPLSGKYRDLKPTLWVG